MSKLAAIAFICVTALPTIAQTKVLVTKGRVISNVMTDDNYALPTACDEHGNSYVKLVKSRMEGPPLLKLSGSGKLEAKFDTAEELVNIYALRPNGGVAMVHLDRGIKVIDNFGPNGKRESEVRLDPPPIPFFPKQVAVFPSGELLIAGPQYRASYKASTAVYDASGHLIKQFSLDGDDAIEHAVEIGDARYTRAPGQSNEAVSRSAAITSEDGLVYLMRATSPATVYAISHTGEVIRKILVPAPTNTGLPDMGIRVVKNRLAVRFFGSCDSFVHIESCQGSIYTVVDATTGQKLADYQADGDLAGPMACYVPDPDRFFTFSSDQHYLTIVEAGAK